MIRAIIFDCDGVLIDSEPLHFELFRDVLAEEGVVLTKEDYFKHYLAMDDRGCFTAALRASGIEPPKNKVEKMIATKAQRYQQRMSQAPPTFPGVPETVRVLADDYPLAIASGALRHEIVQAINALGIAHCFAVIVAAEDVERGKPAPDAYLAAMEGLNRMLQRERPLKPGECLVVEDSINGVESARNAGMLCLAITNTYPPGMLVRANWVADRLDEGMRIVRDAHPWQCVD